METDFLFLKKMKLSPTEGELVSQQASEWIKANASSLLSSPATFQIITSICTNIINNTTEEKFRKIKLSNAKFNEAIMMVDGALYLLCLCGFEIDESDEFLILKSENVNVSDLKALLATLKTYNNNNSTKPTTSTSSSASSSSSTPSPASVPMTEARKKILEEKKRIQEEKDKIRKQLEADKEERKHLPTGVCSRKTAKPQTNQQTKTFKDIGVDLSSKGCWG